ncbi:N-acetylglucosamine-6-phosphate deacetylase [Pediococcus ethanolidurans]|uniref:N-acetylglucosamine-6-phosphate deacetylase n=1 Tax=Pediococcus ethanolidurans TaxID=319653 RepID=A0A0R2K808_9LACO|nr:N-acetylglucosamine-6-phosphate deacetylase [Pediococcus ethanolidurans]KRN83477.1 N-acetylglucosamine-6-phosphate deacetylase [Pediococcus ethanolidurans]GEN94420.1 N-acetylglucosamine-6-phosphate deacetylase [Pediococcus ethanolidurans]SER25397.1 N-acetylglucosamine-6-phosphate deacetylase [Pediococcus ethanolidurans]
MSYYIHADKFFLDNTTENGGYLEITDDDKFGAYTSAKPTGKIVDYSGYYVSPGLVDTHIHGLLGHDVMDNDWNKIQETSEGLLQAGVTSWLPTTLTASADQLDAVCKTIGANYTEAKGAKIQGIYFEGPFFTTEHKGAQNPKYFGDPDVETFKRWQTSAKGLIKKIAIAPERNGAVEFTKAVSQMGVSVALGHSDATFEQARASVEAGATVFTHTFNGMSGLSHHAPGMVGAAMSMHNVIDELICDGHHVEPAAARILIEDKRPDHVALITDCMRAGLMPDGDYVLGEFPVYVADGMARLKDGGSLAGSILQLKEAVKNMVDWNISTPEQAVQMASKTAAISSKIGDQCGSILPGRDADFLIWNHDMDLKETYLDGESRYQA